MVAGGKDWHFWAACAAMERSIIGVYKANRGNWSAYGWRFTGGQATRLNGSKNGSSNKTSNMLNGADVRFILTEDKDPIVTTPEQQFTLVFGIDCSTIDLVVQSIDDTFIAPSR